MDGSLDPGLKLAKMKAGRLIIICLYIGPGDEGGLKKYLRGWINRILVTMVAGSERRWTNHS